MIHQLVFDVAAYAGRRALLRTAVLMLLAAALEGIGIATFVPVLGLLTSRNGGRLQHYADRLFEVVHATTSLQQLATMLLLVVALLIARALVILRRDRRIHDLQVGFDRNLRLGIMQALGGAAWTEVAKLRHARVLNALTTDAQKTSNALVLGLQVVVALTMLVVQLAVVALFAPLLALLALCMLLVGSWALRPVLLRAKMLGGRMESGGVATIDAAAQLLGGLKIASAHNRQRFFVASYEAGVTAMMDEQIAYQRRDGKTKAMLSAGSAVTGGMILFFGCWIYGPTVSIAAALLAITRMVLPAALIQRNVQLLAVLTPAHAAIGALIAELGRPSMTTAIKAPLLEGPIRLDGIWYAHGGRSAVEDLSVTIPRGAVIGIVGPSGAGKTTSIDLLAGLIAPDRGRITIGGMLLDQSSLPRWRERIAYVGQETWLINGTIRRNLVWEGAGLDDAALWSALWMTEADAMVRAMELGLETQLAERGGRLSGGERQRIALAGAVLRRPELLILDEATNAIDIAAERRIMARLVAMVPRPTIVVVAHRVDALECCERILTLHDGRLVADEARR